MSYQIQRPTGRVDDELIDAIQGIIKKDPSWNETEYSILTKLLAENLEQETSLELCKKTLKMNFIGFSQKQLKMLIDKLDELKSKLAKNKKNEFKNAVKESCGIDVLNDYVSMHTPKSTDVEDTALHQEASRMLEYLTNREDLVKVLRSEVKSLRDLELSKGPHSERSRKRRSMTAHVMEFWRGLYEVKSGVRQIEKALSSLGQESKKAYAKMISGYFYSIKAKLSAIFDKTKKLETELKVFIKEGHKALNTTPDFIDDNCEICIEKEKEWDDKWKARDVLEPLGVGDARDFHGQFVKSGGMRGLVDQFKSLLECEGSDPNIILPTLVCSMTDPQRADNLYNMISENNFLKDFRQSILKKTKEENIPTIMRKDCMVCGITSKRCSF